MMPRGTYQSSNAINLPAVSSESTRQRRQAWAATAATRFFRKLRRLIAIFAVPGRHKFVPATNPQATTEGNW